MKKYQETKANVTDNPIISVIMAAYNSVNTIEEAITSVMCQTIDTFELIVIDDCSTDLTREIVKEFQKKDNRVVLLTQDKNCGVSAARRRGLETARGEWIAILDSDDQWEPKKLEKQLELHEKTGAELIFTASGFMNEQGEKIDWILHAPERLNYRQLLRQNLVSNSSVLVKKELYEKYYSSGDDMHEDFATWLRITKSGVDAYGIDEPLLSYRLSSSSKSGDKKKAALMNWNTYRYVGLSYPETVWYMLCYGIRGLLKYRNLRKQEKVH